MEIEVEEAGEKLPELIWLAQAGELVTICRNGVPVANLVRPSKRVLGLLRGKLTIPDNFNDPLPDEILDLFESR